MSGGTRTDWGPGIVEVRRVTSKVFGIRVARYLVPRVKGIQGLSQANPKSDLFCLEVSGMDRSPEEAVKRFRELAATSGLGMCFGGEVRR